MKEAIRDSSDKLQQINVAETFESARKLLQANKLAEATELFDILLSGPEPTAAMYCSAADARMGLGDLEIAKGLLEKGQELAPKNPWVQFGLGRVHRLRNQPELALAHFDAGLEIQDHKDIRSQTEGLRDDVENGPAAAVKRIAEVDQHLERGEFDAADSILEKLQERGHFPEVVALKRAHVAIAMGELESAEAFLQKVAQHDPNDGWMLYNLAQVHEVRNDLSAALASLTLAIEQKPENGMFQKKRDVLKAKQATENGAPVEFYRYAAAGQNPSGADPIKVLSWDMAHNPVGRAAVLADVARQFSTPELIGPIFQKFGEDVWQPLAENENGFDMVGWPAADTTAFFNGAIQYVLENPCSVIWASKARFPSLILAFLFKLVHGSKVVVDLDDDELSFVDAETALNVEDFVAQDAQVDWSDLSTEHWTRLAATMATWADATTACNEVLQTRYGAELVRHARSEQVFDPAQYDRSALRKAHGFSDRDKIVLFFGTPRRHKGILQTASAVADIGDPKVVFLVVGSFPEPELEDELKGIAGLRVVLLPDQPMSKVPAFNAMADVVCAFQDSDSRIAQAQTPAKLSDAAGMGALAITSDLDTTRAFLDAGAAVAADETNLTSVLRTALKARRSVKKVAQRRAFFLNELSLDANARRAQRAIETAKHSDKPLPPDFFTLLDLIEKRIPRTLSDDLQSFWADYAGIKPRQARLQSIKRDLDIVFFWKQNDTGLYQRRQDSVHEELARLPNVRKILHIDASISADRLQGLAAPGNTVQPEERHFVAQSVLAQHMYTKDRGDVHYRTFVHAGRVKDLMGRPLPHQDMLETSVARWMDELGIGDNVMAWVCPIFPGFDRVQDRINFEFVVADFIDDQRKWPMMPASRAELNKAYQFAFTSSDVSFANCQPVVDWLQTEGLDPVLVPNGVSTPVNTETKTPSALAGTDKPIIGYIGNMRDRIDWDLLKDVATARPDWQLCLIGKMPDKENDALKDLRTLPNVMFPGVVPHTQVDTWLSAFDVAVIPHLRTRLSEAMNPLKLYVYRSHGLPVVSTPVSNIGDFETEITIAATAPDTVQAIDDALAELEKSGRRLPEAALLDQYNWSSRVRTMMDRIEETLTQKNRKANEHVGSRL